MYEQLGTAAGGGYGALMGHTARSPGSSALLDMLKPLDYPRQALWNLVRGGGRALSGEGTWQDALGALPGLAGVAGAALGPLGMLGGALAGGLAQGVGKSTGNDAFEASTPEDVTGSDAWLPNALLGAATDPLTYAGMGLGRRAGQGMADMEARSGMLIPEHMDPRAAKLVPEAEAAAAPTVRPAQPPPEPQAGAAARAADEASGLHDLNLEDPAIAEQRAFEASGQGDPELDALNQLGVNGERRKSLGPLGATQVSPSSDALSENFQNMVRDYQQTLGQGGFQAKWAPFIEQVKSDPALRAQLERDVGLDFDLMSRVAAKPRPHSADPFAWWGHMPERSLGQAQAFEGAFGPPTAGTTALDNQLGGVDRYMGALREHLAPGHNLPQPGGVDMSQFLYGTPAAEKPSALLQALQDYKDRIGPLARRQV